MKRAPQGIAAQRTSRRQKILPVIEAARNTPEKTSFRAHRYACKHRQLVTKRSESSPYFMQRARSVILSNTEDWLCMMTLRSELEALVPVSSQPETVVKTDLALAVAVAEQHEQRTWWVTCNYLDAYECSVSRRLLSILLCPRRYI